MQEREHNRRLTERLYDFWLECYPRAFEITGGLRRGYVFPDELKPDLLSEVLEELLDWNRTKSGFVLSNDAIKAFYRIRDVLGQEPADGRTYSDAQRGEIWKAKSSFRSALRADHNFLYVEEQTPSRNQ